MDTIPNRIKFVVWDLYDFLVNFQTHVTKFSSILAKLPSRHMINLQLYTDDHDHTAHIL